MPANTPEDICHLFQHAMADGDLESVLSLYDLEAVFVNQAGEVTKGAHELKQKLAPLAMMKTRFDYDIKHVVETGDTALMHTKWKVSGPQPMTVYAIEVARRQDDGTWRWLIGDPHTVGREAGTLRDTRCNFGNVDQGSL
jgi:ketosteroid isomerase-like protein